MQNKDGPGAPDDVGEVCGSTLQEHPIFPVARHDNTATSKKQSDPYYHVHLEFDCHFDFRMSR